MSSQENASFLSRHKPSAVVLVSQMSAAVVHGLVKTLEGGQDAIDPFLILLIRMVITGLGSSLYLWCIRVPDFPLGPRSVRELLLLRAMSGVLGAGGMYYSIKFLTLSQATALNFLAPMASMILSRYMDHGTFSIVDRVGATIALAGVFMVVQPDGIFQTGETGLMGSENAGTTKLKGLLCGCIGLLGTTISLTTIRRIGSRAHPLISVTYFSWVVVLVATAWLIIKQTALPTRPRTWGFLIIIGFFSGLMESLLTTGVASDPSAVATTMIYSQVLWALALDSIIWDVGLNIWTFVGVGSVVGSLLLVTLAKEVETFRRAKTHYEAVPILNDTRTLIDDFDLESLAGSDEEHRAREDV